MATRPAAVAGSWYPASAGALAREVDDYVGRATGIPAGSIDAIIAPHAGIMFSGPVAAYSYKAAAANDYDVAVLVGPSHFVHFDGIALYPEGEFATPFGPVAIDGDAAGALARAPIVKPRPAPHAREHSLEMQLPFLKRLLPNVRIVPMLMGDQNRATIEALAEALVADVRPRTLLIASTDLSHYYDATTAATLDGAVIERVENFDADGLLEVFESHPAGDRGRNVGCGIGPAISVMLAARARGARQARILKYGHSGEVSGDYAGVVGYLAAAMGSFHAH
jgi:AmmeMemoRadiSam system protein B